MATSDTNRVGIKVSKETVWAENPSTPTMQEIHVRS